jgi:hypothetical protein
LGQFPEEEQVRFAQAGAPFLALSQIFCFGPFWSFRIETTSTKASQ